ncbi:MAG TPA: hypothetical protein VFR78_08460 [Pyrinomonadaceae bacterium]|nr:hypothetical protein [Pyrinomonadaceae bacterium]
MNKIVFLKSALILLAVCAISEPVANKAQTTTDVKIRQRMGPGMETVLYVKGQRMRSEMAGDFGITTIVQCDLKRTLTINDKTKTYMITPADGSNTTATGGADGGGINLPAARTTPQRGGVVNITQTITDTGERREMFGFTARRIKTSLVKTASPDACDKDQKIETDGWYIDFQYRFECPDQEKKIQAIPVRPQPPGCRDEVRFKTIGSAKLGFPVLVTTTIYEADGRTMTTTQEVLELSRGPLSATLFEVPEGYRLVRNPQELYNISAVPADDVSTPSISPTGKPAAGGPSPESVWANKDNPKQAGVIRIGLIMPKVQMSSGDAAQAAEALRGNFASYLKGPGIEVIPLSARLASLATQEALQSQCDYVLSLSMSVKKGGSMFGRAVGNIVGSAAGHIPVGEAATAAAIGGVYTTAVIVSSIKAKDNVTLEYKLEPLERAKQGLENTAKAKANRDNEDVVTGLIEKAAGDVVTTVSPKQ